MHVELSITFARKARQTIVGLRSGFAEKHIRPTGPWAIPLPEKLNSTDAGPLLCGGITVFAPLMMFVKPTDRVGIIGIGRLRATWGVQIRCGLRVRRDVHVERRSKFDEAKGFAGRIHVGGEQRIRRRSKKLAGSFDLSDQHRQRDARLGRPDRHAPAFNGRLHVVGAGWWNRSLLQLSLSNLGAAQRVGFADRLADGNRERCSTSPSRHNVTPQTEHFPMSKINEAFARLESGKARYRIVLDADF